MSIVDISKQVKEKIDSEFGVVTIYNIQKLADLGLGNIKRLPYSLRILLEDIVRNLDGRIITIDDVIAFTKWEPNSEVKKEIAYLPSRVLLQDFTGVPAMVDFAALRSAIKRAKGDPSKINPIIPVDLIIDHNDAGADVLLAADVFAGRALLVGDQRCLVEPAVQGRILLVSQDLLDLILRLGGGRHREPPQSHVSVYVRASGYAGVPVIA